MSDFPKYEFFPDYVLSFLQLIIIILLITISYYLFKNIKCYTLIGIYNMQLCAYHISTHQNTHLRTVCIYFLIDLL